MRSVRIYFVLVICSAMVGCGSKTELRLKNRFSFNDWDIKDTSIEVTDEYMLIQIEHIGRINIRGMSFKLSNGVGVGDVEWICWLKKDLDISRCSTGWKAFEESNYYVNNDNYTVRFLFKSGLSMPNGLDVNLIFNTDKGDKVFNVNLPPMTLRD